MRRLLALAVCVVCVVGPARAAVAQGDARLEVVGATPSDVGSTVTYRVALTAGGEPVDGATVTATVVRAGETPEPPLEMAATEGGVYEGTVSFPTPGNWTVQFDAEDPVATAQVTFRVEAPPPATTTLTPATPPPTTAAAPEDASLADDDTGNDGPPAFLVVGIIVAGVLLVAAATALVLRRRREAT